MTLLTAIRDDRVILLGLGVAAFGVASVMHVMLTFWRDEAEIKEETPKTQYITQETEDSLKAGTLDTLLGHYNFAIRETAAKIVCDRAVNDTSTIDQLLYGITREDYDERIKSLRTLALITDPSTLALLNTPKCYSAFVRSLELCLTDVEHERLDDKHWDDYYLRDMAEKLCLMFVIQLLTKNGPEGLVRARFVEKWLARQNWGDTDEERQKNFLQYMQTKQNRITEIVHHLQGHFVGDEALFRAKLIRRGGTVGAESTQGEAGFNLVLSVQMTGEDGEEMDCIRVEPLPRNLEQSAEEQRLRHRHREAMVLNDGTRPFGRGDIIEREHDSPT